MVHARTARAWLLGSVCVVVACGGSARDVDDDGAGASGASSSGSGAGSTGSGGGLEVNQCRTGDDCPMDATLTYQCVTPGFDIGCGACEEPLPEELCTSDDACKAEGAHFICAPVQCPCSGAANTCVPGCTSSDACGAHQACDATNRCSPKPCTGDGDCPANYSCAEDNVCDRTPCTSDAQCEGYCVLGTCYDTPGWCWDGSAPP